VGAATLNECTDEVTPNGDTDYAEIAGEFSGMILSLSAVNDPIVHTGHIVRVNICGYNTGGQAEKFSGYLYKDNGVTLVATCFSGQVTSDHPDYTTYEYTLTELEAEAITDYSDLSIWVETHTLGTGESFRCTQCELEVPDAAGQDIQRTIDDDLGIGDAEAGVKTFERSFTESEGITDPSQPSRLTTVVRVIAESLGLTDTQTHLLALIRTITDSLGVADVQAKGESRPISNGLGITDAETILKTFVRTLAESLGLTDAVGRTQMVTRLVAETLGMTDSMIPGQSAVRTLAESLGISDVMTGVPSSKQTWQVHVKVG